MNGVELAARFSYITNSLHFCGPNTATPVILKYLRTGQGENEVKDALLKFEGLYPYFSVIAERHKLDLFDEKVVEAYWIGNELLDSCTDEDNKEIIRRLMQRGLPKSIGEKLIEKMPPGLPCHHNFNVMYVGVGMLTQSVPTTLQNMDNCRTSWGTVLRIQGEKLYIETQPLEKGHKLGETETKTVVFDKEILGEVKAGDTVAIHWGFACVKLTENQVRNLQNVTKTMFDKL